MHKKYFLCMILKKFDNCLMHSLRLRCNFLHTKKLRNVSKLSNLKVQEFKVEPMNHEQASSSLQSKENETLDEKIDTFHEGAEKNATKVNFVTWVKEKNFENMSPRCPPDFCGKEGTILRNFYFWGFVVGVISGELGVDSVSMVLEPVSMV